MDHPALRDEHLKRSVFVDAWDGSIPGIWEALGEVRGAYPDLGEDTAREIAAAILTRLAIEGSIRILRVGPGDASDPISELELESILAAPSSWVPDPSSDFTVNMTSTKSGERYYFGAQ